MKKKTCISWRINSNDKNSIIVIARPYMPFKYKLINIIIFNLMLDIYLKHLDSVVKDLKYYRNKSSRKDQFGKHI